MHTRWKVLATLLGLLLPMTACSSIGSGAGSGTAIASTSGRCPYTFAVITHGDNGSYWSITYRGAKDAAHELGCTLSEVYGSQQQGQAEPDDNAQNAQIQDAINAHVSGIVVSDHDPVLMNPTIAKAVTAGIPVVMFNAGCDPADLAATHAITCIGQPEQVAGVKAGAYFKGQGLTNILCVIHQSGQNLLDRCNGIAQGIGVGPTCSTGTAPAHGPACSELILTTPDAASNPSQADQQVVSYLQAHPGIDAVMTLNGAIGTALATDEPGNVKIGTFDASSQVITDLQSGAIDFAIDQQLYLQGYLPIVTLYLYLKTHGISVSPDSVLQTGPLVVTKANAKTVNAEINAGYD
jgi:simple sugar transport system substrate-binding protein